MSHCGLIGLSVPIQQMSVWTISTYGSRSFPMTVVYLMRYLRGKCHFGLIMVNEQPMKRLGMTVQGTPMQES